ncbi:hypothetical protein ACQRD6_13450, partial [Prevotella sp. SGI.027]
FVSNYIIFAVLVSKTEMLKSFFPCTAPMLETLLTTTLNLAAQCRKFEAAATTAASVQLFTKHTDVSFG